MKSQNEGNLVHFIKKLWFLEYFPLKVWSVKIRAIYLHQQHLNGPFTMRRSTEFVKNTLRAEKMILKYSDTTQAPEGR